MKQSELSFKENTKSCVWCTWNGIEFYWEVRSSTICITPDSYSNLFVPEDFTSMNVRREIISFIKETFNV